MKLFYKLTHRVKLIYLKPKWLFTRLWRLTASRYDLRFLVKLEDELVDLDLDVKRKGVKREILQSEGRLQTMRIIKERLGE